jgi:hypothetical protein
MRSSGMLSQSAGAKKVEVQAKAKVEGMGT